MMQIEFGSIFREAREFLQKLTKSIFSLEWRILSRILALNSAAEAFFSWFLIYEMNLFV